MSVRDLHFSLFRVLFCSGLFLLLFVVCGVFARHAICSMYAMLCSYAVLCSVYMYVLLLVVLGGRFEGHTYIESFNEAGMSKHLCTTHCSFTSTHSFLHAQLSARTDDMNSLVHTPKAWGKRLRGNHARLAESSALPEGKYTKPKYRSGYKSTWHLLLPPSGKNKKRNTKS